MLPFSMVDSIAFKTLSPKAVALYVYIARRYNSFNNGNISFSIREAENYLRIGKDTASRLFNDLIERGFIKVAVDSSFSYKQKQARKFEITQWPLMKGLAPSNDWMYWNEKK